MLYLTVTGAYAEDEDRKRKLIYGFISSQISRPPSVVTKVAPRPTFARRTEGELQIQFLSTS
jgi:hypothetical protein